MNELEIIQHRQIEGLSLFVITVGYRTAHVHSEWELIWILDQPLSVTCGTQRFQVEPGQMVFFSPNEPHEFHKVNEECTFVCLQISPKILPPMARIVVSDHLPHHWLEPAQCDALRKKLAEMMKQYLFRPYLKRKVQLRQFQQAVTHQQQGILQLQNRKKRKNQP